MEVSFICYVWVEHAEWVQRSRLPFVAFMNWVSFCHTEISRNFSLTNCEREIKDQDARDFTSELSGKLTYLNETLPTIEANIVQFSIALYRFKYSNIGIMYY